MMLKTILNKRVAFKRYMSSVSEPFTLNTIQTQLYRITALGSCGFISITIYLDYLNQRRFSILNQNIIKTYNKK